MSAFRFLFAVSVSAAAGCSFAATITSGWTYGVSTYTGGSPQITVANGPANVTPQELTQSTRYQPAYYYYDQTADAILYGSATADSIHGFVQSIATTILGPDAPPGGVIGPISFVDFGFTITDAIHLTSATLSPGTPVSFFITETLHSLVSATSAGTCNQNSPAGRATLYMIHDDLPAYGSYVLPPLSHDSCGAGSDLMTLNGAFSSTVGGTFAFRSSFILHSAASANFNQSSTGQTTVNASSTGSITIQVLTPDAAFFSDSGASYAAASVPEPSAFLLVIVGAVALTWTRAHRPAGKRGR